MNAFRNFPLGIATILSVVAATAYAESPVFQEAMRVQSGIDHPQGCRMLLVCAEAGDADCQGEVSACFLDGDGLPRNPVEARNWAKLAAVMNSRSGLRQLAFYEYFGEGGSGNLVSPNTLALARKAAELGDPKAMRLVGWHYRYGEVVATDKAEAFNWFLRSAELGDPTAQRFVGEMLNTGTVGAADPKAAVHWLVKAVENYQKLAEHGNLSAQTSLAYMYEQGIGVTQDLAQAADLYRKAAESGYAAAQSQYGYFLDTGLSVPKNATLATQWFLKAAEQGLASAQITLGSRYRNGGGAEKDPAKAYAWYLKAAEQGDKAGQALVARGLSSGECVSKDEKAAFAWANKSAEQGSSFGQRLLADMFAIGQGTDKNDKQAVYWYLKSADQGDKWSQYELGVRYRDGIGVERDRKQATAWLEKAEKQEHAEAKAALEELGFPRSIRLVNTAKPMERIELQCKEEGELTASCIELTQTVTRKFSDEDAKKVRAEVKSLIFTDLYNKMVDASTPEECPFGSSDKDQALRKYLPPKVQRRLEAGKEACLKGNYAQFRRIMSKTYANKTVMRSDFLTLADGFISVELETCLISARMAKHELKKTDEDQWHSQQMYAKPDGDDLGTEILLKHDLTKRTWTYEVISIREGAPVATSGSHEKYQQLGDDKPFVAMNCKFIEMD
jgi:TPR repeat protein